MVKKKDVTPVESKGKKEFLFPSFVANQDKEDAEIVKVWIEAGSRHDEKYLLGKVRYFRRHIDEYKRQPVEA